MDTRRALDIHLLPALFLSVLVGGGGPLPPPPTQVRRGRRTAQVWPADL
jgi:hypothetical protein